MKKTAKQEPSLEAVLEFKQAAARTLTNNLNNKLTIELAQGLLFTMEQHMLLVLQNHYTPEDEV